MIPGNIKRTTPTTFKGLNKKIIKGLGKKI